MGEVVNFSNEEKVESGFQQIRQKMEQSAIITEENKGKLDRDIWEVVEDNTGYRKVRNKITGKERILNRVNHGEFVVKAVDKENDHQVIFAAGDNRTYVRDFVPAKSLEDVKIFHSDAAAKSKVKEWNKRQTRDKYEFTVEPYKVADRYFSGF